MFRILTLKPGVDAELQSIQDQYEVDAVENLGVDGTFNHYLLVQFNTKPGPPLNSAKSEYSQEKLAQPKAVAPAKPAKGK